MITNNNNHINNTITKRSMLRIEHFHEPKSSRVANCSETQKQQQLLIIIINNNNKKTNGTITIAIISAKYLQANNKTVKSSRVFVAQLCLLTRHLYNRKLPPKITNKQPESFQHHTFATHPFLARSLCLSCFSLNHAQLFTNEDVPYKTEDRTEHCNFGSTKEHLALSLNQMSIIIIITNK